MCFRCGSEDHFVAKCPRLETSDKKLHWNTEQPKTRAYKSKKIDKTSEKSIDESEPQKIQTSLEHMYTNEEIRRRDFGDILQLTNWILDSGVTCHITPDI